LRDLSNLLILLHNFLDSRLKKDMAGNEWVRASQNKGAQLTVGNLDAIAFFPFILTLLKTSDDDDSGTK
jgi:hypothetical protein